MLITDALTLDAASVRVTRDGYLVAEARIARSGVQTYRAGELGLADRAADAPVRVWRPDEEVFAADAMASLAHRPMTMDHPGEPVTAANWKRYAIGTTGGDVARDGDTIRVPLTLMDAAAIAAVQSGKRELSVGYACELMLEDGVTPDGEQYDAVQRSIRGNHVAVCTSARGGPRLRIGDASGAGAEPGDGDGQIAHSLMIDGLAVLDVSDSAKAAIETLQGQLLAATAAKEAAERQAGELAATIEAKDGEIAGLADRLRDAEVTPGRLQQLVEARARVVADAKRIAGDGLATDGLADAAIRRAAVAAKLGDRATDMSDAAIEGAFAALAAGATGAAPTKDAAQNAIAAGTVSSADHRQAIAAARDARLRHLANNHRGQPGEAA